MDIQYTIGDATHPEGESPKIIVHVCNDIGGWGAGFVLAISRRWKQPEHQYREWHRIGGPLPFELGQVQFVEVEPRLWVANLLGQRGIRREGGKPPVRYDAIRVGLARVADFARKRGAGVHMPRIGCGLAGGEWSEVSRMVEEELTSREVPVTVYDLPPKD